MHWLQQNVSTFDSLTWALRAQVSISLNKIKVITNITSVQMFRLTFFFFRFSTMLKRVSEYPRTELSLKDYVFYQKQNLTTTKNRTMFNMYIKLYSTFASTTQNWLFALWKATSLLPSILAIVFLAALRTPIPALQ